MLSEAQYRQAYYAFKELYESENDFDSKAFDRLIDLFTVCAMSKEELILKVVEKMKHVSDDTSSLISQSRNVWSKPEYRNMLDAWIAAGLAKPYDEAMRNLLSA